MLLKKVPATIRNGANLESCWPLVRPKLAQNRLKTCFRILQNLAQIFQNLAKSNVSSMSATNFGRFWEDWDDFGQIFDRSWTHFYNPRDSVLQISSLWTPEWRGGGVAALLQFWIRRARPCACAWRTEFYTLTSPLLPFLSLLSS